jgi:hypothetical protein
MIEVEQIKMRKDIRILHKKYNFTYHALARGLGVSENMIRRMASQEAIFLQAESHKKVKQNLLNLTNELQEAEEYKGFDVEG